MEAMTSPYYRSVLLWIIRIGLFIVPFIPLYVESSLFFPYITGKAFVFRTIIELVFFTWLALAIFYPEYRPKKSPLLFAILVFISVDVLATIFAINPIRAFWSNYERMEGLLAHLHFVAYFFVAAHTLTKRDWSIFFNLFIGAGFLETLFVFAQRLGLFVSPSGAGVVDGTIGNLTYVAAYLTFVLVFALFLLLKSSSLLARSWYGLVAAVCVMSIFFTASRGPVLSLLLGLILFGVVYLCSMRFSRRILIGLIVLALLGFSVWLARDSAFVQQSRILAKLTNYSLTTGSIAARFNIWRMAWQGVQDHPLLGWGPEGFVVVFAKYYRPEMWSQEPWFDRSHNFIFDWLIATGFLGFCAYLSMFFAVFYMLWRHLRHRELPGYYGILFVVLLAMYLFQNLFVFDQFATYMSLFSVFAYLHFLFTHDRPSAWPTFSLPSLDYVLLGVVGAPALFVATWYFLNFKSLHANALMIRAMRTQNTASDTATLLTALPLYEQALDYRALGVQEVREQFIRYVDNTLRSAGIEQEVKLKIAQRALVEAQAGITENDRDPRAYLFLAALMNRFGLYDQTLKVLQQAVALAPKKQQLIFELANTYLLNNDATNAITLLRAAFESDKSYITARMNYVAALIAQGDQKTADAVLLEGFGTVDVADDVLVRAYTVFANNERLLRVRQAFVARDPKNISHRIELARVQVHLGRLSSAVKTIESAIAFDASFKVEGEKYIDEIWNGNFK